MQSLLRPKLLGLSILCALQVSTLQNYGDDWPQWMGLNRDGIWHETTGILQKIPADGLKVLWRQPIGAGYSGPAVAQGVVVVTDRQLAEGASNPEDPFAMSVIRGTERVTAMDQTSGKVLWTHVYDCPYTVSYPNGPRTTPVIDEGLVYTLGAEGNLFCLNLKDGKPVWAKELKKEYNIKTPLWGFSAHPLVDGNKLICLVGGTNSVAVAFDKKTGKELWRSLTAKEPGYAAPVVYKTGERSQLMVWNPEGFNGLDPETGNVLWTIPGAVKNGVSVMMPRKEGDLVLVSSFYDGAVMARLKDEGAEVAWKTQKASQRDTTHLNALMSTPFIENGYIYGICNQGQLRCLKASTGERVWEDTEMLSGGKKLHCGNAFIVKNGPRFIIFNETGEMIFAKLTPEGPKEISRGKLLEPTDRFAGRDIVWSHPALSNGAVFARNDKEIVAVSMKEVEPK
ncbi:MAG: PQQ-binding-like beta-propeller repeat protein [Verrucomicrobiales bacterium]